MRRLLVPLVLGLATLAAAPASARVGEREDLLGRAERAYREQRYGEAIEAYERLVATGIQNEELFYNLANAYVLEYRDASRVGDEKRRAGKLGRAILYYERALRLEPGFDDAAYNLQVARDLVAARFGADKVKDAAREPLWIRAATWLPLSTLAWTFLALDVAFFGILVAVRFLPTGFVRTGLIVGEVFVGAAGLVAGLLLAGHVHYRDNVRVSVIVADEVVMREGPDPSRREMPTLHAGLRVVILRESDGWYRVRLANHMEGYVPKTAVEEI